MKLPNQCSSLYGCYIFFVHTTTGHESDAASGQLVQLGEKRDALLCRRLLTRGEDAAEAHLCKLRQGTAWVTATVESAVEGDRHALGLTQQLHIVGNIHIAISGQTTKNHPIDTQLTTEMNVLLHPFYLQWGIEEIAATRTDDDMQTSGRKEPACHHYLAIRGGHTTFGNAST